MGDCRENVFLGQFDDEGVNHVKTKGAGVTEAGENLLNFIWVHSREFKGASYLAVISCINNLKVSNGSVGGGGRFSLIRLILSRKY